MNVTNQSPVTVPTGQAAVQAMAEGINNGLRPQGSTTPDSNVSTNKINSINAMVDIFVRMSRCVVDEGLHVLNLQLSAFLSYNRYKGIIEHAKLLYELMNEYLRLTCKSIESYYKTSIRFFMKWSKKLSDDGSHIMSDMMKMRRLIDCKKFEMCIKLLTIKFTTNENCN